MKLKKFLVSLLATALLVVPMNFSMASAADEVVNSEAYTSRLELFNGLNLLSETVDYSIELSNVKRADFIMAALRINDMDKNIGKVTENPFVDVVIDDPVAPYVKKGVDLGYLSGYSDGEFRPNDPIRIEQAVKVMVKMLGYTLDAEASGGYPNGYITVADNLGVLDDIVVASGAFMTYGEMLKLFENALDVEVTELKASGSAPSINYETDTTFLEAHHRVFYEEGVLDGNDVTALKTGSVTAEGMVTIDGIRYYEGRSGIAPELGKAVKIYYQQDEDEDIGTILYYTIDADNYVYVIDNEDLYKKNDAYSYTYFDERDRAKTISITDETNVIYNGKLKPFYKKADLNPAYGQVTLIDNNNDEIFDVISIFDIQKTIVVSTVSQTDAYITITDAVQRSNSYFIEKEGEKEYLVLSNGIEVDPANLKSGSVLSIGETENYALIQVSEQAVVGTLQSKLAENFVVIDGSQYKAQDIYVALTEKDTSVTPLTIGLTATFRIDIMGAIVGVDGLKSGDECVYGFLFKVYQSVNEENQVKLKLMKEDGKIETFEVAELVTLNGKKKREAYEVKDALDAYNPIDEGRKNSNNPDQPVRQLIKYKVDENNVITEVWTASNKADSEFQYKGYYTIQKTPYEVYRRPNTDAGSWGRRWYYDSTSTLFCIYPTEENCFVTKFQNYDLNIKKSTAGDTRNTAYFYDQSDSLVVGAIIVYCPESSGGAAKNTTSTSVGQYHRMHAVTKVYEGLNDEEEATTIVEAINTHDGTNVKIYATEESTDYIRGQIAITKPGDLIQYGYNDIGELTGYRRIFLAEEFGNFGAVQSTQHGNVNWGDWTRSDANDITVDEKECTEDGWEDLVYQSWLYSTAKFVDGTKLVYTNYKSGETNMIPTQNTTEAIPVSRINISNPKKIKVETGLSLDVITPGSHFVIMTANNIGSNGIVVIEK